MGAIGNTVRKILYKTLPLQSYLGILSKLYFTSYNLGFLKGNKVYEYPYFLPNIIKSGDICIDIGANMGYLTVLFSKLVGDQGKVYAVEPTKPMLQILGKNTRHLKNVEILPYALGEENKSVTLGNDTVGKKGFMATGSHQIIAQEEKTDIIFDAEMRKGSELFSKVEKIDFIKCDIEGYELVVMEEIKAILLKHEPILLIESRGTTRHELTAYLNTLGFNCYVLDKDRLSLTGPNDQWDLLVVPESKLSRVKQYIK